MNDLYLETAKPNRDDEENGRADLECSDCAVPLNIFDGEVVVVSGADDYGTLYCSKCAERLAEFSPVKYTTAARTQRLFCEKLLTPFTRHWLKVELRILKSPPAYQLSLPVWPDDKTSCPGAPYPELVALPARDTGVIKAITVQVAGSECTRRGVRTCSYSHGNRRRAVGSIAPTLSSARWFTRTIAAGGRWP